MGVGVGMGPGAGAGSGVGHGIGAKEAPRERVLDDRRGAVRPVYHPVAYGVDGEAHGCEDELRI